MDGVEFTATVILGIERMCVKEVKGQSVTMHGEGTEANDFLKSRFQCYGDKVIGR